MHVTYVPVRLKIKGIPQTIGPQLFFFLYFIFGERVSGTVKLSVKKLLTRIPWM